MGFREWFGRYSPQAIAFALMLSFFAKTTVAPWTG